MALIGAIIGDIIGSQYEFPFMRPDNLDWKNCILFTDECEFTDDTVMSIATKVALDKYKGDFKRAYREFYELYPNKSYGDMFEKWLQGRIDEPYGSYGNGSAMRVSYIGDLVQEIDSATKLINMAVSCTHNSESGIRGAIATVSAIVMSKSHYTKEEIFEFTNKLYKNCIYDCSEDLKALRKSYIWSETCDRTVPVAIRCFLESDSYESCIRNCLSLPCDMDTICCIAGGIAEAFYGTTGFDNDFILKKYLDKKLYQIVRTEIR